MQQTTLAPSALDRNVVAERASLRRLMEGNPAMDALLMAGYIIGQEEHASFEGATRDLLISRETGEEGTLFTVVVSEDAGAFSAVFEALIRNRTVSIQHFTRGEWQGDLDSWYQQERAARGTVHE